MRKKIDLYWFTAETGRPINLAGGCPQIHSRRSAPIAAGPISQFGFAVPSREDVDPIDGEAKTSPLVRFGPTFLNPYGGYLCILQDPDGHNVAFSHGQSLGKSVEHEKRSVS